MKSFKSLNIRSKLLDILAEKGYETPTDVQKNAIPMILKGKSTIVISNTGSGKTLAFAIPIINDLLKNNQHYHSLICAPTRELAKQIEAVFHNLGESLGLRILTIIGGENEKSQKESIFKSPHIIIGTPGRLNLILKKINLFKKLKFLVLDESDKLLEKNYENDLLEIISNLNEERITLLFSATMTDSVERLARLSLRDPVKVEINKTYETVDMLDQKYFFIPFKYKDTYLVELLKKENKKTIVFVSNCLGVQTYDYFLKRHDVASLALHGNLKQEDRLNVLEEFKNVENGVLVATDVASRGIDIPFVDLVVNFDLPKTVKEYVHRVGRTARAGRKGGVVNFVTQYDIQNFQMIEKKIELKMEEYKLQIIDIKILNEKTQSIYKEAYNVIKEKNENKSKKRKRI